MTIAVCESVAVFNTGAACKALLMQSLGVAKLGSETLKSLRKEDKRRVDNVAKKSCDKCKVSRKDLRMKMKRKPGIFGDISYKSGAFGLEVEPQVGNNANKMKNGKRNQSRTEPSEIPNVITFWDEKDIVVTIDKKRKR